MSPELAQHLVHRSDAPRKRKGRNKGNGGREGGNGIGQRRAGKETGNSKSIRNVYSGVGNSLSHVVILGRGAKLVISQVT